MFSRTIFKQTLKSNYKLWVIFTAVMALMSAIVIAVYDSKMITSIMDMVKDMPGIANMVGDRIGGMTSLLGMLGESFYTMQGIILTLIFVIMTANSLVASQVDRGSMAYILSTPIKRTKVIRTQALYLISSVLCMYLVVTLVGLASVQLFHQGLWGTSYTADVKAAADVLEKDSKTVSGDLGLILGNDEALKAGAKARDIETDVYSAYLNMKLMDSAYEAAAGVLGTDVEEVRKAPALIRGNQEALEAAAKIMKMEPAMYGLVLSQTITQSAAFTNQASEMQTKLLSGITAAAEELDVPVSDLASSMGRIKENPKAMSAAVEASGMPEAMFVGVINYQLAADEAALDKGLNFVLKDYVMLNLGAFLLMFAIGGISFLFSCVFNLSKNSLALGAGIPIAFLIFQIMAKASSSLESFKYLSLNSLFVPADITGGGTYWPQFAVLAVFGLVLYALGIKVFKEKDLPL